MNLTQTKKELIKMYLEQKVKELEKRIEQLEKKATAATAAILIQEVETQILEQLKGLTREQAIELLGNLKTDILRNTPFDEGLQSIL